VMKKPTFRPALVTVHRPPAPPAARPALGMATPGRPTVGYFGEPIAPEPPKKQAPRSPFPQKSTPEKP
jgi:hypothetical protein